MVLDDRRAAADESRSGHPGEETLAAYADGKLSFAERLEIERHLSSCHACREAVADTVAFLVHEHRGSGPATVRPFRRRTRAVVVITGLAAAAALIFAVRASWDWFSGPSNRPELKELVAAFAHEPSRPVEGRLTGGFSYAPAPQVMRGPGPGQISPDVQIAVARIETAAERRPSPGTQWNLGVARLALRNFDGAVSILEEASRADPSNADLQSDLAAAYLARGRSGRGDDDLTKALAAADRALALKPDLPEARFNRALALEALRMNQASAAWQTVIAIERDSPWEKEASLHVSGGR